MNRTNNHTTADSKLTLQKGFAMTKHLSRRYLKQRLMIGFCLTSIFISLSFIVFLIGTIIYRALPALTSAHMTLEISVPAGINPDFENGRSLLKKAIFDSFPYNSSKKEQKQLFKLLSYTNEYMLDKELRDNRQFIGSTIVFEALLSGDSSYFLKNYSEADSHGRYSGKLSSFQRDSLIKLQQADKIIWRFNSIFFSSTDSREPENAGILGALLGSLMTLSITLLLSLPIGVASALYLEEFAPKNFFTNLIEININNLAAVPSIVFGLLGLALFINFFSLPRSSALVGGLVLSLMTLPVIIIASRASIKAVPASIKHGALALGASPVQLALRNTLPLALPGILTGSVIGLSRALGETAPLLLIGMVAFISSSPSGIGDATTVLPVQIYIWADSPEKSYVALSSLASAVLLIFLITMNATAIYLRKKHEKSW